MAGPGAGRTGIRLPALPVALALALGILFSGRPAAAATTDSPVQVASYTTGQMGSKLKWLPARPSRSGAVLPATGTERPIASEPARLEQEKGPGPYADPFDDAKLQAAPSAPAKLGGLPPLKMPDAVEEPSASKPEAAGPGLKRDIEELLRPPQRSPSDQFALEKGDRGMCVDLEPPRALSRELILEAIRSKQPGKPPQLCTTGIKKTYTPRDWEPITFHWTASALCHKPAYFEDVPLSRYGHTWGPWLQPFVSAGYFFLNVPALPYAMAVCPPNECIYTLGYYRPGSCAPYVLDPLPLSIRAALMEGGVWTGMVFLIP